MTMLLWYANKNTCVTNLDTIVGHTTRSTMYVACHDGTLCMLCKVFVPLQQPLRLGLAPSAIPSASARWWLQQRHARHPRTLITLATSANNNTPPDSNVEVCAASMGTLISPCLLLMHKQRAPPTHIPLHRMHVHPLHHKWISSSACLCVHSCFPFSPAKIRACLLPRASLKRCCRSTARASHTMTCRCRGA